MVSVREDLPFVDLTQRYSSCYSATVGEPARLRQEVGPGPFGNFLELRQCEVRRIPLPRTWVNKGGGTLRLTSSALARLAGYCYLSCLRKRRSRLKRQPRVVCCSLDHSQVSPG